MTYLPLHFNWSLFSIRELPSKFKHANWFQIQNCVMVFPDWVLLLVLPLWSLSPLFYHIYLYRVKFLAESKDSSFRIFMGPVGQMQEMGNLWFSHALRPRKRIWRHTPKSYSACQLSVVICVIHSFWCLGLLYLIIWDFFFFICYWIM